MKEANIIKKFRDKLPGHWTSIENSVTSGVPDYVVSRNGNICWIEFKRLYGCDIIIRPLQLNWIRREVKHNSRIVVAWWDDGPAAMLGSHLVKLEPKMKGGKIHYTVTDLEYTLHGWDAIDNVLFRISNV